MKILSTQLKDIKGRYTTKSYAFTLIELLVVIAIIGILAGVVIASLNSARTSGRVAAIKSNLKNLQTQAQLYHLDNGTFAGLCNKENTVIHASIKPMIDALKAIAGNDYVRCLVRTSDVIRVSAYHASDLLEIKNFGVAVYYNDTHYGVDAQGIITLDKSDSSSNKTWVEANQVCTSLGKRLPSIEIFKAIGDYGANFGPADYWSSTPSSSISNAQNFRFSTKEILRGSITTGMSVRCAS